MNTILIIIWLLLGVIGVWREYHGSLKNWYELFNESYWDFDKKEGTSALRLLFLFSPLFILGGAMTIFAFEIMSKNNCWWFTTKNKQ